ncbi:MAG: DUF2778 domain-containing protein [Alphaproteobacteria bacterium]|nr:DUF2778 domain-containing protein [Alphaproteobacteria bacterium]
MSIKEYTSMRNKDWVQAAGTLANIYAKLKGQQGANNGRDSTEQCDGIVQVSGYTRADGTEVAPYERICPYHYNGQKPENKDKKEDKNKEKDFSLSGTVSANNTTNEDDVIKLKKNLYKMNYYKPNERSEPDEMFHKYANTELITAIKDFQRDNNLPITGRISSGDETERVLNTKFESHGAKFEYPVNTNKNQVAVFDGKKFTLYEKDKPIMSWDAVSGNKGYQTPEFQSMKDKGTIPEGTYVARQQSLQGITIYGSTVGLVGVGTWPGGQPSWGKSRIALEASTTTNTYSRGGFYVHGGWTAGSNGCIDLTENLADFTQWLKKHGQDLIVKVSYR